ncbi:hypothetical protein [Pseudofulvibacter geojedonensis]|uniref:Uncharacterized protein n=1 Tax=Pseudofulvibacter geojedonensis TaxID=1123758 RepID=A0ABW3I6G9_9FLAO
MNLQRILTILIAVIGIIGFAFWVMIVRADETNEGVISMMIGLGKFLVGAAAIIAIVFSLINIASDPAKLKRTGIALIAFLVVIGIGYGLSDGQEVINEAGEQMVSADGSKKVGAGLRIFYILSAVALGAMLVSGVKKALNK